MPLAVVSRLNEDQPLRVAELRERRLSGEALEPMPMQRRVFGIHCGRGARWTKLVRERNSKPT